MPLDMSPVTCHVRDTPRPELQQDPVLVRPEAVDAGRRPAPAIRRVQMHGSHLVELRCPVSEGRWWP
jgi:hypothetical protein